MRQLILFISMICLCVVMHAQNEACNEALLATKGNWKPVVVQSKMGGNDGVNITRFLQAVHQMMQPYKPAVIEARPYYSMSNAVNNQPVNYFTYTIAAHEYFCSSNTGKLTISDEAPGTVNFLFNQFNETSLYDTSMDYMLTGFIDLRHGLPVEIRPGIWQFPVDDESLGFGRNGKSKLWLITFDGELPWSYVTRKEFLTKRKRNLQYMLSLEADHLKEQLEKWEYEKKGKEQELKSDPVKLGKFIENTYKPGIERENQNHRKTTKELGDAIERVNNQLSEPGMDKPAIVIKSQSSSYDYDFTNKAEPFAEVLTKPNPYYFRRKLGKSVPQFISVELIYDHENPVYTRFAQSMEDLIDLDLLKSFIGKTVPGVTAPKPTETKK